MTDQGRLDRALARAAERIATMRKMYDAEYSARIEQIAHLEGWAEAVEILSGLDVAFHVQHGEDCGCDRIRARDKALRQFCDTMLGGSDE